MKLVRYQNGRIRTVLMSVETQYSDTMLRASAIEREIKAFAQPNGDISCLSIDFAGQYVPIVHSCEARLVAALLASYQTESGEEDVKEAQETLPEDLRRCLIDSVKRGGGDQTIDGYLKGLQQQRPHLLHTRVQEIVRSSGAALIHDDKQTHSAVNAWLQSPRTISEIAMLTLALNEGVLMLTPGQTDSENQAEHVCIDMCHINAELLFDAAQPTQSKMNTCCDMSQFEKELDVIATSHTVLTDVSGVSGVSDVSDVPDKAGS